MSLHRSALPREREQWEDDLTVWFHGVMDKMIDNEDLVDDLVGQFEKSLVLMSWEELECLYNDHIIP